MAEEKPTIENKVSPGVNLSLDDISALEYVLRHTRGASPSSLTPLELDTINDE